MENKKHNSEATSQTELCAKWRRRTFLERSLILICVVTFIALLGAIGVIFHVKHVYKPRLSNFCTSTECTIEAGRIASYMDTSIDPCEDFYNFSCGKFLKIPVTGSRDSISVQELSDEYISHLYKEVLEAENKEGQPEFIKKVKQFYRSCLNKSQDITDLIKELLKKTKFKSWPILWKDGSLMDNIEKSLAIVNIYSYNNPFMHISRSENHSTDQLNFNLGHTSVSEEVFLNTKDEKYVKQKEKYKKLLDYTIYILNIPFEVRQNEVEEIIEFETNLAKITSKTYEESEDNATKPTLKQFSSDCLGINWVYVIRHIYDYFGHSDDFNEEIPIALYSKEYADNMCKLLIETEHRTIYNYLVWFLMFQHFDTIDPYFRRTVFEINRDIDDYVPTSRWEQCTFEISYNSLHPGLSYLVIKRLQPEKSIDEVKGYADEIKKSMDHMFTAESWLDSVSRDIARKKLKDIRYDIGYSSGSLDINLLEKYFAQINITDSYLENNLLQTEGDTRLTLFNDTFEFSDHVSINLPTWTSGVFTGDAIEITVGKLVPPHFRLGLPKYLNYGMVGFTVAHELLHGFDQLDDSSDAWPEETIEQFKHKKQCYIDQYSKFPFGHSGVMVNGTYTARENIADNNGLIQCFTAYENYVHRNGPEPTLPGLDFTSEQLFFIRYAQSWCKVELSSENDDEYHSPARYRVTGPLRNFPRFSEVFSCPLHSPMNPRYKCQMYG